MHTPNIGRSVTRDSSIDGLDLPTTEDTLDVEFPSQILAVSFSGRYGAFLLASGVAVMDFKYLFLADNIRFLAFYVHYEASCVALWHNARLAIGTTQGVILISPHEEKPEQFLLEKTNSPRASAVTALAWVDAQCLAVGTLAGTVQLWEGSVCLWQSGAGPSFRVSQICTTGSSSFCSVHGDAIVVWENKNNIRQILTPHKGLITSLQWAGVIVFATATHGMWTMTTEGVEAEPFRDGGGVLLSIGDTCVVAAEDEVTSDTSVIFGGHFDLLGYLDDLHLLAACAGSTLRMGRMGGRVLEGSPRMHPTQSSATFVSDPETMDEWRPLRTSLGSIRRCLRRTGGFLVNEDEPDSEGLTVEILNDGDLDENTSTTNLVSLKVDTLTGNTIWSHPAFSSLTLDDLIVHPSNVVQVFRRMRPIEEPEVAAAPFPPTCGICWSPNGDLFRFSSLKGLWPFPAYRAKLTMQVFGKLDSKASRLNDFWAFEEPLEFSSDDDKLETEFDRVVVTDQCVQFVPASLFQRLVKDHWFATIAPMVDLSLPANVFCPTMAALTRSMAPLIVADCWACLAELFRIKGSSFLANIVFQEKIKQVYLAEETQTVALVAAIFFSSFMHAVPQGLLQTCIVVMHDHAGFFARLGCFASARFLEKVVHKLDSNFPLIGNDTPYVQGGTSEKPCFVCSWRVFGLSQFCMRCGHGGHVAHMEAHFGRTDKCVCGCLCRAMTKTTQLDSVMSL